MHFQRIIVGLHVRGKNLLNIVRQLNWNLSIQQASRENRKVIVYYKDLLKEIPGGADILWEERSVVSQTFECCGECMHEEWGDNETPLNALFRLYKRVRMAAILDADD